MELRGTGVLLPLMAQKWDCAGASEGAGVEDAPGAFEFVLDLWNLLRGPGDSDFS